MIGRYQQGVSLVGILLLCGVMTGPAQAANCATEADAQARHLYREALSQESGPEATALLERSVALCATAQNTLLLAQALLSEGRYHAALEPLSKALFLIDPAARDKRVSTYWMRAHAYWKQDLDLDAKQAYEAAITAAQGTVPEALQAEFAEFRRDSYPISADQIVYSLEAQKMTGAVPAGRPVGSI